MTTGAGGRILFLSRSLSGRTLIQRYTRLLVVCTASVCHCEYTVIGKARGETPIRSLQYSAFTPPTSNSIGNSMEANIMWECPVCDHVWKKKQHRVKCVCGCVPQRRYYGDIVGYIAAPGTPVWLDEKTRVVIVSHCSILSQLYYIIQVNHGLGHVYHVITPSRLTTL